MEGPTKAVTALFVRIQILLQTERGQTLAEYGLLLTLVGIGVVVPSMLIFRSALSDAFNSALPCLSGSC